MTQVTIREAQQRLPELLAAAEAGETIEIQRDNGRTFRLVANRPRPAVSGLPRAGTCRGLIQIPDDFDAPLEELHEYLP
jgi:antitoxin (DNA-binding transcriptional repressor) of toxin-antitoxin stability system